MSNEKYNPKELRNRHLAIMSMMLANPQMTQKELATTLGYEEHRLGIIIKAPLFKYAYKQYVREHQVKVSDLAADATVSALRFSMRVVDAPDDGEGAIPVEIKQDSAKDILSLGHAKAVERRASLDGHFELPREFLGGIQTILDEVLKPFEPTRQLTLPPSLEEEERVEDGRD